MRAVAWHRRNVKIDSDAHTHKQTSDHASSQTYTHTDKIHRKIPIRLQTTNSVLLPQPSVRSLPRHLRPRVVGPRRVGWLPYNRVLDSRVTTPCLSLPRSLASLSLSFSIFSLLYQLFFFCFSFPLCAFRSCASRLVFCRTPHLWWCVCLCVCVCMTNPKVIFKKDLIDRKVIDYLLVSL